MKKDESSELPWWKTTPGKIGILAASATIVAALIPFALNHLSKDDNRAVIAAREVRACVAQHKMKESSDMVSARMPKDIAETVFAYKGTKPVFTIFRSCEWPPPKWAQPDGYTAISVMSIDQAFPRNVDFDQGTVDRFFSRCHALQAEYTYSHMGGSTEQTYNFKVGEIYLASANRAVELQVYYDNLEFSRYPNEAVVAHGAKHTLRTVRCTS